MKMVLGNKSDFIEVDYVKKKGEKQCEM